MRGFRLCTHTLCCAGTADPDCRINFHSDLTSHAASCPSPGEVKAALHPAAPGHKGWAGRSSWHRGKLNSPAVRVAEDISSSPACSPYPAQPLNLTLPSHSAKDSNSFTPKSFGGTPPPFSTLPSFSITFQGKTLKFCCMFLFFYLSFQVSVERFSPLLDFEV